MEDFKASDSLKLIQSVIELRQRKYEENGFMLLFWGALVMISGVGQFAMIKLGKGNISGWIWVFMMCSGFIFTFINKFKKEKNKAKNSQTTDSLGWIWVFAGILALLNGLVFGKYFGQAFTFTVFMPLLLSSLVSAISIKNFFWITMSILGTIITYCSIFVPLVYSSLFSAFIALIIFVLPGLHLYLNHKKNGNV